MSEIKILPDPAAAGHRGLPAHGRCRSSWAARSPCARSKRRCATTASRSCSPPRRTRTTTIRRRTTSMTSACVATVLQLLKLPDGTVKVLVEGRARAGGARVHRPGRLLRGRDRLRRRKTAASAHEAEALSRAVVEQFENYVKLNKKVPPEALASIPQIDKPGKLADRIAAAPVGEDRREAAAAGDLQRREAPGEGLRPDGGRDQRHADREEDPQPREAPDGEDPARVLPERADEGDPARAGRAGRHARRADRAREAHQEDQALQGSPRPRPRPS